MSKLIFLQLLLILYVQSNQDHSPTEAKLQERSHARVAARPHQRVTPLPRVTAQRRVTPHPRLNKQPLVTKHPRVTTHPRVTSRPRLNKQPLVTTRPRVTSHPLVTPHKQVTPHQRAPHPLPRYRPQTPHPPARRPANRPVQHPDRHRKPARLPARKEFRFHPKPRVQFAKTMRRPVKQIIPRNRLVYKRRVINGVVTLVTEPISPAGFSEDFKPSFSSQDFSSPVVQTVQSIPSSSPSLVAPSSFQSPIQESQQLSAFQSLPYRAAAPRTLLEKEELLNNRVFSLFRELNITSFILKTEEFSVRALVSPVRTQFIPIEDQNVSAYHGFGIDRLRRDPAEADYYEFRKFLNRKNKKNKKKNKKNNRHGLSNDLPYEPLHSDTYSRYGSNHQDRSLYGLNDDRSRFYNYNGPNTYVPSSGQDFKKKA